MVASATAFQLYVAPATADTLARFQLSGGVTIEIAEAAFNAADHNVYGCDGASAACRIDGRIAFGVLAHLPKTYVKSLTARVGHAIYRLDVQDMFDAWGTRPLEIEGVIRYFGGRCSDEKNCQFRGLFSDAGTSFVAEWIVVAGAQRRTVIAASQDVVALFRKHIDPVEYD